MSNYIDLNIDDLLEGMDYEFRVQKVAESVFEQGTGNMFPVSTSQKMWTFAKGKNQVHLSDNSKVYSFSGELGDDDTDLERIDEIPLPAMFENASSKGKAQVHSSDPGSLYFTMQEGTKNPTYTLKHMGGNKWRAIVKKPKRKVIVSQPVVKQVEAESFKQGALQELENFTKQGGFLNF